jgi:hypothetical protein
MRRFGKYFMKRFTAIMRILDLSNVLAFYRLKSVGWDFGEIWGVSSHQFDVLKVSTRFDAELYRKGQKQ